MFGFMKASRGWRGMLRHRRVWLVLFFGLATLLFVRFSTAPSLTPTAGGYKADAHDAQDPVRPWFGLTRGSVDDGARCAFGNRTAKADFYTYDIWEQMNEKTQRGRLAMDDNYWAELKAPRMVPKEKLEIIVMPHSHADPGWLKTYKEYTVDTNHALGYMLDYLPTHPNMTFTWTEVAFFKLWWDTLHGDQKTAVKRLITRGQFELTSGSWTMTDEANPYFWASIDNIVEGHQFLQRELGLIPRVEWSNDPFGYGPSVPLLFHKAGIRRLAVNRVHKSVKMWLQRHNASVFHWRQLWDETGSQDVTTHLLPFMHYDIPNSCGPNPSVCCQFDFKRLTHFYCPGPKPVPITPSNVAERAELLYNEYRLTAQMYQKANVVLVILGDDFRFIDAAEWSQQHDNYAPLFEYMNGRADWNVHARFGTFSDYFDAVEERTAQSPDRALPSVAGDFFPYNDFADHYWTGYFTSRPHYKRLDRVLQAKIRSADLLSALALSNSKRTISSELWAAMLRRLERARRALALFQHHDAITGTSKWHVVDDYGYRLWKGIHEASEVIAASAQLLLSTTTVKVPPNTHLKDHLSLVDTLLPPTFNVSELRSTIHMGPGASVRLSVFNPQAQAVTEAIRVHVSRPFVSVRAADAGALVAQVNPVLAYPAGISMDVYEVVFLYKLPPLSLSSFTLTAEPTLPKFTRIARVTMNPLFTNVVPKVFKAKKHPSRRKVELKTDRFTTLHDPETGLVQEMEDKLRGRRRVLEFEFLHYRNTRSGAYLFMPSGPAEPWPLNATVIAVHGPVLSAAHSFFQRIHSALLIYNSTDSIGQELHVENTVDLRDMSNSEVIIRVKTDEVQSDSTFYTDAVGLQMLKRRFYPESRIETNYYPMPSTFVMQDDESRLTILSGQPHGATSPADGVAEIMLDRICLQDDFKGLGSESLLRDNVPARSHFRLLFQQRGGPIPTTLQKRPQEEEEGLENADFGEVETAETPKVLFHSLLAQHALQRLLYPPAVLRHTEKTSVLEESFAGLDGSLPCDSVVLTLRPLPGSAERLLLVHRPPSDCGLRESLPQCHALPAHKAWSELLALFGVTSLQETNLSGVKSQGGVVSSFSLNPMDIRAFRVLPRSQL